MSDPILRLLLVEDDPEEAMRIERLLAQVGHPVVEACRATSLSAARQQLTEGEVDLVLLDLDLPDSHGLATLHELAEVAADVPIVVVAERADEALALAALREGAEELLTRAELDTEHLPRALRYALERERRSRRDRFLAESVSALASTLDFDAVLRTLAHLVVPAFADWCVVEILTEQGELRALEIVAADARKQELLRRKLRGYPHEPVEGRHPVDEVVRTRSAKLLSPVPEGLFDRVAHDGEHLQLLRELGARSLLIVPLIARERVLGTLTLALAGGERQFDEGDLALAEELGRGAALAVDNARRLDAARQAQQQAECATERIQRTEVLCAALVSASTPQEVAAAALAHVQREVGAMAGVLLVTGAEEDALETLQAEGVPEALLPLWRRLPGGLVSPLRDALRTGRIVALADRAALERRYPGFAAGRGAFCTGTVVAVPLRFEERTLGVVLLVFDRVRRFTARERASLRRCVLRSAAALERAGLYSRERSAHAAAEKATQLRDEVLGIVAHDLRNPIATVIASAALLQDPGLAEADREESIEAILSASSRMDRLIEDLLQVARIEAGRLEVEPRPTDPRALLREARMMIDGQARQQQLRVEIDVPDGLPAVAADRERILQVLANLLGNAVKFTPSGGRITLAAEAEGNGVRLRVSDTGPGIPAEQLPHLFDRFWQAKESRRGGAGLGLAIARGIVERHGSSIEVESRVGAGSSFSFTLPVVTDRLTEAAAPAEAGGAAPAFSRERPVRVLLVDDHAMVRRGLREHLRRVPGVEVVGEASSGAEGVQKARLLQPDVVVMDLNMEGMDGLEATRQIVAQSPDVRVLAVTAEAEDDVLLTLLEAGGSGFVRKTTAHEDLAPALEAVLRGEVFLYPSGNKLLLSRFRIAGQQGEGAAARLTRHEREVLALAAIGYTSPEIGKQLFLSPKTVDSYRSKAMRKLGLGSRPELVRFALREGLVSA